MRIRINSGFTLIELMVTIAVLAIIMTIAAPSFVSVIENSRVTTQANTLLAAVNLARSEAVKQGVPVSIQSKSGDFANGWCVVNGDLGANDCTKAAEVLKQFPALENVTVSYSSAGLTGFSFNGRGYRESATGDIWIALQPPGCATGSDRQRRVDVSNVGRATITQEECD